MIILTEESFHGSGGTSSGSWSAAMEASISFQITEPFVVPEYPLGTLLPLVGCFAAFVAARARHIKSHHPK
jgi:hypothetical protein